MKKRRPPASSLPPSPRLRRTSRRFDDALEALPGVVALTLLAGLPAFMNLNSHQIFEEQKSLLLVAGAAIAVPGLLFSWRRVRVVARDPLVRIFLAFVLILFIASIGPEFPRAFWGAYNRRHGLLMWTALTVLFLATCDAARGEAGRRRLILAIVIGSLWPSIYLLVQRLGGDPVPWIIPSEGFETGSTFGNRVLFGGYLAVAVPLTTMLAVRQNWMFGGVVLLQMTALMAAGSRGGVLAVAAAAVVFAGVVGLRRLSWPAIGIASAAVTIPLVILIAFPALRPSMVSERFDLTGGSARVRVVIWQEVAALLRATGPRLVIGHGPESMARLIGPFYSSELTSTEGSDAIPDRAHNEVLDTLVNGGFAGLMLQAGVFALAMWRLRSLENMWMRAGVMAALVAHIVEIQFGIATVASRLAALAIIAVAVGIKHDEGDAGTNGIHGGRLFIPAVAAALSPFLSALPARSSSLPSTGSADDFIAYLDRLAAGTTLLYVVMAGCAVFVAWTIAPTRPRSSGGPWMQAAAVVASAGLVVPLSLGPTWADGFTAAGATYEGKGQWTEAVIAYREAARRAPDVAYYRANLGRALINFAMTRPPAEREPLLKEVDEHYRRALTMEPFDPDHSRHLAALLRFRAYQMDGQARSAPLEEADRVYADVTRQVSTMPSLWIEWAYLDLDRGRPESAKHKLDHAVALGGNTGDREKMADLRRLMAK